MSCPNFCDQTRNLSRTYTKMSASSYLINKEDVDVASKLRTIYDGNITKKRNAFLEMVELGDDGQPYDDPILSHLWRKWRDCRLLNLYPSPQWGHALDQLFGIRSLIEIAEEMQHDNQTLQYMKGEDRVKIREMVNIHWIASVGVMRKMEDAVSSLIIEGPPTARTKKDFMIALNDYEIYIVMSGNTGFRSLDRSELWGLFHMKFLVPYIRRNRISMRNLRFNVNEARRLIFSDILETCKDLPSHVKFLDTVFRIIMNGISMRYDKYTIKTQILGVFEGLSEKDRSYFPLAGEEHPDLENVSDLFASLPVVLKQVVFVYMTAFRFIIQDIFLIHLGPFLYGKNVPILPVAFNAQLTLEQKKNYTRFFIAKYGIALWIKNTPEDTVPNIPLTQCEDMAYWNTE